MPRKSVASLSVVPTEARPLPKPEPSKGLGKAERKVFRSVVDWVVEGHFVPGDTILLERYAVAIVMAREADAEIKTHGAVIGSMKTGQPLVNPWISVRATQEKIIASLTVKLRLSPQSRRDPLTHGRATHRANEMAGKKVPWQR